MFKPSMSILTAFLPQKAAFYQEVLSNTIKIINARPQYFYPYLLGGRIYTKAQELFAGGQPFKAYDGKTWDSSVGIILGEAFRPWMVHCQGLDMLPSGSSVTSLLDTMANIVATRFMDGTIINLGDDINYWGKQEIHMPFIEYSPDDSKYKYILGVAFEPRIEQPRITGIKASMDRARMMKPLLMPYETPQSAIISRRRDARSRVAWAGLFHGWFGDRTLLDSIARIRPDEILAPTEYIEEMIESGTQDVDVYAWAEREGVKNIFP